MVMIMKWSIEEDEFLKENYKTKTSEELAEIVGRSQSSVKHHLLELGLRVMYKWTPEQDEVLKNNYQKTDKELSQLLKRSQKSIRSRREFLGLYRGQAPNWSKEEDEKLRKLWNGGLRDRKIIKSHFSDRTLSSIKARINNLSLPEPSHWTTSEETLLRELYPSATQKTLLEKLPRHSWLGIRCEANVLKLKRGKEVMYHYAHHYEKTTHFNIQMTKKMWDFVQNHKPLTDYLRGLIEADMKK
jgi:hypothetical protein